MAAGRHVMAERWQQDPALAGTRRFRAAYLTVWGVPTRSIDCMDVHMQMAKAVRQAYIAAAL